MNKPHGVVLALTAAVFLRVAVNAIAAERFIDFAKYPLGETPSGFRSTVSGDGQPGIWKVIQAEWSPIIPVHSAQSPLSTRRPVLAQQASDPTDEHFPLLIYDEESFGDFTLTTRFMMVDGVKEQMAGVAFRIRDEKNYYVVRASALGRSFLFYKLANGQRSKPVGSYLDIPKGIWHEMTIECKGNTIRCLLNGKEVIPPATDYTFAQGKIGFWTKSDSISYFTDTRIQYTPHEYLAKVLVQDFVKKYDHLIELKLFAPSPTNSQIYQIIASTIPDDVGRPAGQIEQDVIKRNVNYSGKDKQRRIVTLPLHDANGEVIAAVRIVTKTVLGQTEANAVSRALPLVKEMEQRVRSAADLYQ